MFRSCSDVIIPREEVDDGIQGLYVCDLCPDGWLSETEVEIHRANVHKKYLNAMLLENSDNVCKCCIMKFLNKEDTIRHIKSNHLLSSEEAIRVERDIYICDICCEIFFNKLLLIIHINSVHTVNKKDVLVDCPSCDRNLRVTAMWYHFRRHKIQSVACCRICCKKFKDRIHLTEHIKTHINNFRCEICGYDTKKPYLYKYHIVTKHKLSSRNVDDTKVNFKRYFMPRNCETKWKVHTLMGWKGLRLSNSVRICVLCREICVGEQEMKNHIVLEHMVSSPEVSHKCICGSVFTSKVMLKHHLFKSKDGYHVVLI